MGSTRAVREIIKAKPVLEGAGVRLKRVFGFHQVPKLDPFLLLDDFHSDQPQDYAMGFPWHPHRGIETVSYILEGHVEHEDSLGNHGIIANGDVQWMTAGNGIVHQEMPKGDNQNRLWGFQLWANLPAKDKMISPRYQEIKSDQIPEVKLDNDVRIKIICGRINETQGPVTDIVIEPEYLDITIPPNTVFQHSTPVSHTVFAYMIQGKACFDNGPDGCQDAETLVIFDQGDQVEISTQKTSARFLLISGKPIQEPIAWHGPIVMNTDEELETAFKEYLENNFLKHQDS